MLKVYGLVQAEEWDKVVKSFQKSDVYYLSGYAKGFYMHGDGEPKLIYYDDGAVRGINVVMLRDIALSDKFNGKFETNKYFDISTPYGYGGWIIEGDGDKIPLFEAYENWCKENGIISEFVRFHPVLSNSKDSVATYDIVDLSNTVTLDLTDQETIWNNFTSQNRNKIRKAQKNGLTVGRGLEPELFGQFKDLYEQTMRNLVASDYYYFSDDYYQSVREDLKDNAQIFYVKNQDGKVIAASIIMNEGKGLHYHLSGSDPEYKTLAPVNLMLYEVARWGSDNGYKTLHLGGGVGSAEDSLLSFKKSFYRGELTRFSIGKKIFDQEKYDMLMSMRGEIANASFFPAYRA